MKTVFNCTTKMWLKRDSWTKLGSKVVPADPGDVVLVADVPVLLGQDVHRDVFTFHSFTAQFRLLPSSKGFVYVYNL